VVFQVFYGANNIKNDKIVQIPQKCALQIQSHTSLLLQLQVAGVIFKFCENKSLNM